MNFFGQLQRQTETSRKYLLTSPLVLRCMQKKLLLSEYVAFLKEAYHHVKHTVPLLMAVGSRLSMEKEWLRVAVAEYIEEELGHHEWILNDLENCGEDKAAVRQGKPGMATELMIAYAYDTVQRKNPLGFFGMVLVLEGTSASLACIAADAIQKELSLPDTAFRYLRSHGTLDLEHLLFFENLMNRVSDREDQAAIVHAANMFYKLYAEILRTLATEPSFPASMEREMLAIKRS